VRDLGIIDKVIPPEERQILEPTAAPQAAAKVERDLFSAIDEMVAPTDEGRIGTEENQSLNDAEMLLKAGPQSTADWIRGEKTARQIIDETAEKRVPRQSAAKSVWLYTLGLRDELGEPVTLSGEQRERAIQFVQAGEDIDVAVSAALKGNDLLAK